jgi:hypothetical protein
MGKGKKNGKKPGFGANPSTDKTPRLGANPSTEELKPVWRVGRIDFGGPWCPQKSMPEADLLDVIDRLRGLESMTWDQIGATGSHFVEVWKLIKEAKERLQELKIDDIDELYSLRFTNLMRLWGIREGRVFSALWWDPEHKICPSPKKHT